MNCRSCIHWQGNRYQTWADCYWVVGTLEPKLFKEKNELGFNFTVPFDPHDANRFNAFSNFVDLYKSACTRREEGIKVEKVKGLKFIQTREDYNCGYFMERSPISSDTEGMARQKEDTPQRII